MLILRLNFVLGCNFQLNIDETCFMCSKGSLKSIGDANRKRHDKNICDNRLSITVLRCGSAASTHTPVVFIMSGKVVPRIFTGNRLHKNYGLPEGSCVLVNDNAYMDDATWVKTVDVLAPAIRKLPIIREHPEWWTLLTFDGFKSHVNMTEALKHSTKIRSGSQKKKLVPHTLTSRMTRVRPKLIKELQDSCWNLRGEGLATI